MATITSLTFAVTSTYSGRGLREARRDIQGLDDGLRGMDKAASNIAGTLGSVTNAALLFGPALIPIATAATGVAGGLTAATAAAGGAAAIFGGALFGSITRTTKATKGAKDQLKKQEEVLATLEPGTKAYADQLKKVEEAERVWGETLANLSPAQRRFTDSIGDMSAAWSVFLDKTEKDTLTPTSIVMDAVSRNLNKLIPVVKAVSPLIAGLATDFARWMDGPGLDRFVKTIVERGVPALAAFIDIGQNVIGVLGKGIRDFLPYGNELIAKLAEGARSLKDWADGGGFTRFLDRVHEVSPSVKDFFLALTDALRNIATAAGDLSGASFSVLTTLLQVLGSLPPELLANLVRAWLAWNSALIVYNVVGAIASAVTIALATATSPFLLLMLGAAGTILAVVAAIAALGVGIYFLVKHWDTVWSAVRTAFSAAWDFVNEGLGQLVWILLGLPGALYMLWKHWDTVWGWISDKAQWIYDHIIKPIGDGFKWLYNFLVGNSVIPDLVNGIIYWFNFLAAPIIAAVTFIKDMLAIAWEAIRVAAVATWNAIVAAIVLVWNGLQVALQATLSFIQSLWSTVWTAVSAVGRAIWAGIQAAAAAVWTAMRAVFQTFLTGIQAIWSTVWNAVSAVGRAIWGALQAAASAVWAAMRATFQAFLTFIQNLWSTVWNAISTTGRAIWSAIQAAALAVWNAMRAAFQAFLTGIQNLWTTVWNAIRSFFQTLVNAIATIAQTAWNLIRSGLQAFLTFVQNLWNAVWTTIRTFFGTFRDGVVTIATNLWDRFRDIFSAGSTWLRTTFWNPVRDFFTKTIPGAFDTAVSAIGKAWDVLRKVVMAPVKAIVDVVYNRGIVKLWNIVAGAFGAPKLSEFTLPGFATGGPVNGPGSGTSDSIVARLSAGEHVWTAKEVAAAGGHEAVARMRSAAMGGTPVRTYGPGKTFDEGGGFLGTGIGPDVGPDLVPDGIVKNAVGKLKDLALGAISGPFGAAVDAAAKLGKSAVRAVVPGSDNALEQMGVGMVDKIADTVKAWVKDHDIAPEVAGGTVEAALTWARSQVGKPYQWGGVGPGGYDCSGFMSAIQNVIMGDRPHKRQWATGAFSGGTAPSGWKRSEKAPFMVGITNKGVGHTAGTLNGVNVESAGGVGVRVGSKARGYNNAMFSDWYGFLPSKNAGAGGATKGAAQATAKAMLKSYGWGADQWPPLQALWQRESGWNYKAKNPSSGAYGIPQALPASKMAAAGGDYLTNATTQIKWGLGYIKGRYGSPSKADAFQRSHNWYALGTPGANRGPAVVGEYGPEIMNLRGGERIDPLNELIARGGSGDIHVTVTIPITGRVDHGVVDRLERETIPKLTMAIKQGVGRRP